MPFLKIKRRANEVVQNPLLKIWPSLKLFERKIITAIAGQVSIEDPNTKVYSFRLIDFELDNLNPSDITERLRWLTRKTISIRINGDIAFVPLLTDIRYDDHKKHVTITFNSILKTFYADLNALPIKMIQY